MEKYQKIATSAFIYYKGKVLIAQRAANEDFLADHWENVGGSLEWGEHPSDGLLREVLEESGLRVQMIRPYLVHHYLQEDKGAHIVEAAYICHPENNPIVKLSDEHQAYKWISEKELAEIQPMTEKMRSLIVEGFRNIKSEK